MTYYKVLDAQGRSCHGGNLRWSLPTWNGTEWEPGRWMPRIGDIMPCVRGYHICRAGDLLSWLHERIWVIEVHPDARVIALDDKVVTTGPVRLVQGTAWDEYTSRLFAVACAHDVPPLYEAAVPGDTRVHDALVTARECAHGRATETEMAAAGDAAWSAAGDAAWAAAGAAARTAAWAAAGAAARTAAAWAAAWDAAWAAAVDAQTARLLRYLSGDVDV